MPLPTIPADDPRSTAYDWLVATLKANCPTVAVWHEWRGEPIEKSPLPASKVGLSIAHRLEAQSVVAMVPSGTPGVPNRRSFRAPILVLIEVSVPASTLGLAPQVVGEVEAALDGLNLSGSDLAAFVAARRAAGVHSIEWARPMEGDRDATVYRLFGAVRIITHITR